MSEDRPSLVEPDEDSYYVSITDMLIGLLFLFLLMLMYFAVQLKTTNEDLVTAEETRNELLEKVATYLRERSVKAEVDFTAGVLRLPDEVLFDKGKDEPSAKGIAALGVLADALSLNLPCYAYREKARDPTVCEPSAHNLEAIFVEGHTDSDPISPSARIRDNWDLSAARATNTFRILVLEKPELNAFLSAKPGTKEAKPVLSVAAYADQRPIQSGTQEAAKRLNRRIDVRFLMVGPKSPNSP